MKLPTVEISSSPQLSIDTVRIFLIEPNGFRDTAASQIFPDHPKLKKLLKTATKNNKEEAIKKYVDSYFEKNQQKIDSAVSKIKTSWAKVGKKVLSILAQIMNTDWQGIPLLTWDVGIVGMYPRFLDEKIFQTYYLQYPFQAIPTALHEITHFIYFKKWAELFPTDSKETFEFPHPIWHLSELMAEAINSDERLRILIPDAEGHGHPIYRNMPFQKNKQDFSQYGYFAKKYLEFKKAGKPIDNFLKEAREEIKELKFNT